MAAQAHPQRMTCAAYSISSIESTDKWGPAANFVVVNLLNSFF
jgi:hypothetical protein